MSESTMSFAAMLELEQTGEDRFRGLTPHSPWEVLFGGQLVAQGLRAAAATAPEGQHVHSLHAYYVLAGDYTAPVDFSVERVRDGRSFSVRSIVAEQEKGRILTMSAGFHRDEGAEDVPGIQMPATAPPDDLVQGGWNPMFERRYPPLPEKGRALAWTRLNEDLGDDPLLQACALAFMADDYPDDAVRALLTPDQEPSPGIDHLDDALTIQSLDYSIWFHRPISGDGWQLVDIRCSSLANSCAMAVGEVFDHDGVHVATIGQHMLVRPARRG